MRFGLKPTALLLVVLLIAAAASHRFGRPWHTAVSLVPAGYTNNSSGVRCAVLVLTNAGSAGIIYMDLCSRFDAEGRPVSPLPDIPAYQYVEAHGALTILLPVPTNTPPSRIQLVLARDDLRIRWSWIVERSARLQALLPSKLQGTPVQTIDGPWVD